MQRFLRKAGSNPPELFVWTGQLAKKAGFEEVWAADAADAAKSPPAPQIDQVGRSDLRLLNRKELASYAAFRLELELDPGKLTKDEIIERICEKQGWDVPEVETVATVVKEVPAKPLAMEHAEVVAAIEGAAKTVAEGHTPSGEACVLMMIQNGGLYPADPFAAARQIDLRAIDLMGNAGGGVDGTGKQLDGARSG